MSGYRKTKETNSHNFTPQIRISGLYETTSPDVDCESLSLEGQFLNRCNPPRSAWLTQVLIHHLPACAPPSTWSISPEVNVASVRNKAASTTSLFSPIVPTGCNPFRNS